MVGGHREGVLVEGNHPYDVVAEVEEIRSAGVEEALAGAVAESSLWAAVDNLVGDHGSHVDDPENSDSDLCRRCHDVYLRQVKDCTNDLYFDSVLRERAKEGCGIENELYYLYSYQVIETETCFVDVDYFHWYDCCYYYATYFGLAIDLILKRHQPHQSY